MTDPQPNREFVFRTIQLLMLADIGLGVGLVLLGWLVLDLPSLEIAGAFLACMGLGLAVLFGVLGRRARAENRPSPHQRRR